MKKYSIIVGVIGMLLFAMKGLHEAQSANSVMVIIIAITIGLLAASKEYRRNQSDEMLTAVSASGKKSYYHRLDLGMAVALLGIGLALLFHITALGIVSLLVTMWLSILLEYDERKMRRHCKIG